MSGPPNRRVVHLSDLHLGATPDQAAQILEPLVRVLGALRATWGAPPSLLAITGDLFDSPPRDLDAAVTQLLGLVGQIRSALGAEVPTLLMPGNHDRRTEGLLLPFRTSLLHALDRAKPPRVRVGGLSVPFLAELVEDSFHDLPFAIALVDSSYTPNGFISAGGLLRVEDLLDLAQRLVARGDGPDRPLLLLTHHHLVPTPVTDTSRIDADTKSPVLRWLARHALAGIVAYADHEEWMMTALGAGSALSTLQAFGRPVFVLHGHKHYPTVRSLCASLVDQGDIVLLSAGSAGLALALDDGDEEDVARLWPSFHVLEIKDRTLRVRTVAYYGEAPPATRELLSVEHRRARWLVTPVDDRIAHESATLLQNEAAFTLRECGGRAETRWDVDVVRVARALTPFRYTEHLRAAPGARFVVNGARGRDPDTRAIEIPTDGTQVGYTLVGGAVRTVEEALRAYGPTDPYEGVELLCRYESREARLSVAGLPAGAVPFGSVVDLTRGRALPRPVSRRPDGSVELIVAPCSPRMRLRIQWRP